MKDKRGKEMLVGDLLEYEGRDWITRVVGFRFDSFGRQVVVLRDSDFVGRMEGAGPTFTEPEFRETHWVVAV